VARLNRLEKRDLNRRRLPKSPMPTDDPHEDGSDIGRELHRLRIRNRRIIIASTVIWLFVIVLALFLLFALLPY
jgi:hypothetical protein